MHFEFLSVEVELKNLPKSQAELTVELSPDEMSVYFAAAARELSRSHPIAGFRPGLAPKDAVIREVGQDKFNRLAFDLAVRESFSKTVLDHQLEIVGDPRIAVLDKKSDSFANTGFAYRAVISVVPQVDVGNWRAIKTPLVEVKVEPKDVDAVLEDIKKSRAENTSVNRPAQKGDRVEIDFLAQVDGVIIEGGESKQHPLVLGEGHFMPGFENELVGLKENETKKFSLDAPSDYHKKDLAGKKVDFEVKMCLVQERKLPEINDELARSLGRFGSLEELKASLAEGLKAEKEARAKDERRAKIATALVKNINAELPEELVELELDKMSAELEDSLAHMNLDKESYLAHLKKTPEDLKKDWRPQAEKRIKVSLALRQIARHENIEVAEAEVEDKLSQLLRNSPPVRPGQNLDLTSLRGYVKGMIRNEKVFELLESN